MREITVATVQMKPELGHIGNNLVKMSDYVSSIVASQKVDLIIFPELITSGYELGVQFTELAQRVPGPAVNLIAQRAADAGVFIAFGMPTKEKVESILYNSAVLIGPGGELIGAYHKVHLRGEERMAFREGFKVPVFETGEIGKIGLMIGHDLAFPEMSRVMALEGAELVCVLADWESQHSEEWRTYVRARAFENALFIAAANRVGEDVTMRFGGGSMIVGPRGKVYAALDSETEAVRTLIAEQQTLIKELAEVKALPEKDIKDSKEAQAVLEAAKVAAVQTAEKVEKIEATAEAKADKSADVAKTDTPNTAEQPKPEHAKDSASAEKPADGVKAEAAKTDKSKAEAEKMDAKTDDKPNLPAPAAEAKPAKSEGDKALKKPADPRKAEPQEGFCIARVDLDEVRRYREEFQTLQTRQPTAYKIIVKRY